MVETAPNLQKFGRYPCHSDGIPTAEASYADGYETGLTWEGYDRPGGPHAFGHDGPGEMSRDRDWVAYCEATRQNLREWKRGFADGLQAQRHPSQSGADR